MANITLSIRNSVASYLFKRKSHNLKRNKKLINLAEAKSIGIVYFVTNEAAFNTVKALVKELTTRQRQVMAIGFINRKSIPNYCIAANAGYYFNKKELNWYGAPKNDYIKEFINTEFDILIDLTLEDNYVLRYISGLSKSRLKVGKHNPFAELYLDILLDMKQPLTMEALIEQVLHYLLVLKGKN